MTRSQYLLIGISIGAIALIYSLPKGMVENKRSSEPQEQVMTTEHSADDGHDHQEDEAHEVTVTGQDQEKIQQLRKDVLNSDQEEAWKATMELGGIYKTYNLYDSAAFYAASLTERFSTVATNMLAGDYYYEAFTFAIAPARATLFAEKARHHYQLVLAENPDMHDATVKVGMTHMESSNPMKGVMMIRGVLEKDPDHELASFYLGVLAIRSGQYDKAIKRLAKVLEINPSNEEAAFYRAVALKESGATKEAISSLNKIIESTENEQIKFATQQMLQEIQQ